MSAPNNSTLTPGSNRKGTSGAEQLPRGRRGLMGHRGPMAMVKGEKARNFCAS